MVESYSAGGLLFRFERVGHLVLFVPFWRSPAQARPQPIQITDFISHLTNSNGCGNLQVKVLLTVSPFRPFLPPQPVCILVAGDSSRHMRHVAPRSLPFSARCAYFPSPQGCTLIHSALHVRWSFLRVSVASPMFSAVCRPFVALCALFRTPVLCFQQLAASFRKTPGVGIPNALDVQAGMYPP